MWNPFRNKALEAVREGWQAHIENHAHEIEERIGKRVDAALESVFERLTAREQDSLATAQSVKALTERLTALEGAQESLANRTEMREGQLQKEVGAANTKAEEALTALEAVGNTLAEHQHDTYARKRHSHGRK